MDDEGTLFLDEIGDLSLADQAKVLRAIETGEVETIGSEKTDFVDVRYILATNKDLKEMVKQERFREDLLHRINVIEINIPPLRERRDDILPLTDYYFDIFCSQNNVKKKELLPDAQAVMLSHSWHGNVRELRNVVEKIVILLDDTKITGSQVAHLLETPTLELDTTKTKTYQQAKQSFEKSFILHALSSNNWNVVKTARNLGLERSVLYKKMNKYGRKKLQKKYNKTTC